MLCFYKKDQIRLMKKLLFILTFLLSTSSVYAANTTGYAWSESVGWFDFSNATITDTTVTGYAYNDNTGWLVLDGVTNDGTGILNGYAWSESVGYFDFYGVTITNGTFEGYAYNDNTGWLSFDDGTAVTTTWVIATAVEEASSRTRGQRKRVVPPKVLVPTNAPTTNTPPAIPTSHNAPESISNNSRDLELNATGEDVRLLQRFLNQQGFEISTPGQFGSLGYETTYFGALTQQALIRFQQANNITPSVGYFGPLTRAFMRTLTNNN